MCKFSLREVCSSPLFIFSYFLVIYNRYCVTVPSIPVTQVCIYKRTSVSLSIRQSFNSPVYLSLSCDHLIYSIRMLIGLWDDWTCSLTFYHIIGLSYFLMDLCVWSVQPVSYHRTGDTILNWSTWKWFNEF